METNQLADNSALLEGSNTSAAVKPIDGNPYPSRTLTLSDRGAALLIGFLGAICLLFRRGKQTLDFLRLPIFAFCVALLIFFVVFFAVPSFSQTQPGAPVLSNYGTGLQSSGTLTQSYGLCINASGQLFACPFQIDALSLDPTPTNPSNPCGDLVAAELAGANGNFAVPTQGLSLSSGNKIQCPFNPLSTAKNGTIIAPSALFQIQASWVIPNQSQTNSGPSNIVMSGHSGTCGANGHCATMLQPQTGMSLAQMGTVQVTAGSPPTVAGTVSTTGGLQGVVFNTSWVGLSFQMYDVTTGNVYSSIISAVTCTNSASIPCAGAASMSLSNTTTVTCPVPATAPCNGTSPITQSAWNGPTSVNQAYYIGFPGTVTISGTTVTGSGTNFNSSWVGATFDASILSGVGANCAGTTICTIASVSSTTSLTLTAAWSGGTCATACNYMVGTVYGPAFSFAQSATPVSQGSSLSNGTIDVNASASLSHGVTGLNVCFPQEQAFVDHLKISNPSAAHFLLGCLGTFNNTANSGPFSNLELTEGNAGLTSAINPTAATVSSVTNGTIITWNGQSVYPGKEAYAIFTFSAAPLPNFAAGQLMQCSGITNGGAGTVYNGNFAVIAQITPTSAWVLIPTTHASDSTGAGGTCIVYPGGLVAGNQPYYRNRGVWNTTINAGTGGAAFAYTSSKAATWDGTSASTNMPVGAELSGGAGSSIQNLFVQGYDIGIAIGEIGPEVACNYFGLGGGGSGTGTTATYISSQFHVGPCNMLEVTGTSGFPTTPTNTLVDAFNTNTFSYNSNPDIGFYDLDLNEFPITDGICGGSTAAICTNGLFLNGTDGIQLNKASTTPSFKVNAVTQPGFITANNTIVLATDVTGIVTTTPGVAEFTFTGLQLNKNYGFECRIMYQQATAAGGVGFSIAGATNAPTRLDGWADIYINAPTNAALNATSSAVANVTTTTATPFTTATPSAINTTFEAVIWGTIQEGGTNVSNLAVLVYTAAGGDAVTLKAGSKCSVNP